MLSLVNTVLSDQKCKHNVKQTECILIQHLIIVVTAHDMF